MADVGRSFAGEFANFAFQFVFRSDLTFRQSLTVKTEIPAAPEQVTAARADIPGGFPHTGGIAAVQVHGGQQREVEICQVLGRAVAAVAQ